MVHEIKYNYKFSKKEIKAMLQQEHDCNKQIIDLEAEKKAAVITQLETKNREANIFIKWIAELLNMETDGVGFDEIRWGIDDFQEAIERYVSNFTG